jgi:UDP-GlcNAc3NAcA epimerase
MKIVTIVGARPQIIKAAALSRAISNNENIDEIIVHTGQHYDDNMSEVFFRELGIPKPHINLKVGSGSHGQQTAIMIHKIEEVLLAEKPDAVVVYGDTNSTLATAIAAAKIHVPIAHIEAGLRSFNKKMPEEINRIMCDHVSSLLFCPTTTGFDNLIKEGFDPNYNGEVDLDHPKIYHCGDVMYDNSIYFSKVSDNGSSLINDLGLVPNEFILSTVHRNDNTDVIENLTTIFLSFLDIVEKHQLPIVLPLHPRTSKMMNELLSKNLLDQIAACELIRIIPPTSFLDIIALEKNCRMVITDSGGVQKEAYFFKKPCVILRPQTEWIEIVKTGSAVIADANQAKIIGAVNEFISSEELSFPPVFGDGKAAEFIVDELVKKLN